MSGPSRMDEEHRPAHPPRRVVVLRHGETTHNASGVWQGHLDSPLSERGEQQARAAAEALAVLGLTRVVASDLARARRTGEVVAERCGIPMTTDLRFREIHAGEWQGLTGADVRERYPEDMDRIVRGEDFRRGVTGESVADVAERCRAAIDEVLSGLAPGERVLVATHGVAGRALAAELVRLPQMTAWRVLGGLGNCHWGELVEDRGGWRLQTWNAVADAAPGSATSLA